MTEKDNTIVFDKPLQDLSEEMHNRKQILNESQKLCSYVLGLCNVKAEEVIESQKLNHENPVHLIGLAGTFISDIFLRDWKRMVEKLAKYEEAETEKSSESSSLEANDGSSDEPIDNSVMDKEESEDLETKFQSQPDLLP
jgi:hypothetical protein